MRYRKLTASGDMTFGEGQNNFFINNAAAVAQYVQTRLGLMTYEWFLDLADGTPYGEQILGERTQGTYDLAIRDRILNTAGVNALLSYSSDLNRVTRLLTVTAEVDTTFGPVQLTATISTQTNPFN